MNKVSKYNFVVSPSFTMRKSQLPLYAHITECYKANKPVTLPQIIELYSEYGCRQKLHGKPAKYGYDYKNSQYVVEALNSDELRMWAVQWAVRNIGTFVAKGYLKAIPTIEVSEVKLEEDK